MLEELAKAVFVAEFMNSGYSEPECVEVWNNPDKWKWSEDRERAYHSARAALTRLREPTKEMVEAGYEVSRTAGGLTEMFRAMIDAALEGK